MWAIFLNPGSHITFAPKRRRLRPGEPGGAFEEARIEVNFCRGKCYMDMGGFVGSEAMLEHWLDPMVKKWVAGIETLARIAVRFPQIAYTGLVLSLQSKWQYICRDVPGAG